MFWQVFDFNNQQYVARWAGWYVTTGKAIVYNYLSSQFYVMMSMSRCGHLFLCMLGSGVLGWVSAGGE